MTGHIGVIHNSMPKKCLFADEVEEGDELQINSNYAHHYEQWRRKELIQKLKDRHGEQPHSSQTAVGSEDSSDSSSDDEYCEPDNPEFNRDFLRALGALQAKGVQALKEQDFFATDYSIKKKEKEEKPMTLKDYERHIIMERGGKLEEDEEESGPIFKQQEESQGESSAKSELMKAFHDDSDDEGGLLESGLFKVKEDFEKPQAKLEADADVVNFLKGKAIQLDKNEDTSSLQTLKEKWNDPKLSRKDKWLADFFLNQRYLEDEDDTIERAYNEVAIDEETLSDDEKTLEKMDDHDHSYRFRFEEPDKEFIRKYPRNIDNSLRTQNNKRKEERAAYEQRKKEEKEQKRQEIAQLKALKYQEIKSKIEKIKEVSGNDDLNIENDELEEDFDPAAHDAKMANMFGDTYYDVDQDQDKPLFSDDDEDLKDYDQWIDEAGPSAAGGGAAGVSDGGGTATEDGDEGEYWDEENFNMDADDDPSQTKEQRQQEVMASSSRINRRRRSKFAVALKKKKPVFDPVEKDFDEYFEEYYNLDFEDIVGGLPCRFKYRKVEPNDFGLSTEDILNATVPELNKWVAIRKIIRYDRTTGMEKQEKFNYDRRSNAVHIKQKILPSLFKFNPEDAQQEEEEKKRQKNLKKKLRKQKKLEEEAAILGYVNVEEGPAETKEEWEAAGDDENVNEGDANMDEQNPNIVEQSVEDGENGNLNEAEANTTKKKKKKKKKKNKHNEETEGTDEAKEEGQPMEVAATKEHEAHKREDDDSQRLKRPLEDTWEKPPKKKHARHEGYGDKKRKDSHKKHKKHHDSRAPKEEDSQVDTYFSGISDARLAAYGANPKKMKGKARYGKTDIF